MSDMPLDENRTNADSGVTPGVLQRLVEMEGLLRDVYRELGGSERAIREEREGYSR